MNQTWTLLRLAAIDLRADWPRAVLNLASLVLMVSGYLGLIASGRGYEEFGKEPLFTQNLIVIQRDVMDPMTSSLTEDVLVGARASAGDLAARVTPCIFRHMRIENWVAQVRAVPPEDLAAVYLLELARGRFPQTDRELVVSEGARQVTGWDVGRVINVYGANFTVTGVVNAGGNKFASLWMNYSAGLALFGEKRGFQMATVQLRPGADPLAALPRLEADPTLAACCSVYMEGQISARYADTAHDVTRVNQVMQIVALISITFGVYNLTWLTLEERARLVTLLRVVGFSDSSLLAFLTLRAWLQVLPAYGLGWALAGGFVAWWEGARPLLVQSARLTLLITPADVSIGLALVLVFTGLGVWLPGRQATRRPVVEGLRE